MLTPRFTYKWIIREMFPEGNYKGAGEQAGKRK